MRFLSMLQSLRKVSFSFRGLTFFILSSIFLILSYSSRGAVLYGVAVPDSTIHRKVTAQLAHNPILAHQNDRSLPPIEVPRLAADSNFGFLFSVILLLFLGLIKQTQPNYLRDLFRAFGNATLSKRQLREQLQQNYLPGIMMDFLFCFSAAFFIFQIIKFFRLEGFLPPFKPILLIVGLSLCIAIIYWVKYLFLKALGWSFQAKEAMDTYSFNVTLFNRVLGVTLLPFTIILALGGGLWGQFCLIIALLIVLSLYLFRFVRSRQVFRYLLQLSKFHFILYLCTAEIIPLAVIVKLISIWLLPGMI